MKFVVGENGRNPVKNLPRPRFVHHETHMERPRRELGPLYMYRVVLYGCETWYLTLREGLRLRMFKNKVLRKIFGAKRDEITEEWRKLNKSELHTLYSLPNIIRSLKSRRLRWAGHVACMKQFRNAYRVLVGKPQSKRPLGRPRRRWEDNIKMDLREWIVILEIG